MTNKVVMFNIPAAKHAKTWQVPIMWTDDDEEGILYPYEDALVISTNITSKRCDRILVDIGSSVDVMFESTLDSVRITGLRLESTNTSLKGFRGGRLIPLRLVELPVTIGTSQFQKIVILDFVVVNEDSPIK